MDTMRAVAAVGHSGECEEALLFDVCGLKRLDAFDVACISDRRWSNSERSSVILSTVGSGEDSVAGIASNPSFAGGCSECSVGFVASAWSASVEENRCESGGYRFDIGSECVPVPSD